MNRRFPALAGLFSFALLAMVGCAPDAAYQSNLVYVAKTEKVIGEEFSRRAKEDVRVTLASLFGTPDEAIIANLEGAELAELFDSAKLAMSTGPVGSDEDGTPRGLYRKHCVHCHGISGDGRGPTAAFLNPYPRNFTHGVFKFKSTPKGGKPTDDDLRTILKNGIQGTAMPSFKLLDDDEIDSLVEYVKFLSIRGEVERKLIELTGELDFGEGERLIDLSLQKEDPDMFAAQKESVAEIVAQVAGSWSAANGEAVEIAPRPEGWDNPQTLAKSINHGRRLFYGSVANCVKCHGNTALGDGQKTDYDDWSKEIEPENPQAVKEYVSIGALPPRNIHPRNLRQGVYRGGRRPIDIYWRIRNGIDGTPMPAALVKPDDAPADVKGLTEADLWSLVDYVRWLPFEAISQPQEYAPGIQRERM